MSNNRTIILASRPAGPLKADNFDIVDQPMPEIKEGQLLVRNLYGSLDAGTRKLFGEADGYIEPIPVGSPVGCLVLGEVVESRHPDFSSGQVVVGTGALQEYSAITPGHMSWAIDTSIKAPLSYHMSVLGSAGMTAYFGILDAGQLQDQQTVLVSAAAGAVGSLVGQIAKIKGCTVVGIAGGPDKSRRLVEDYGFDAGIDYRGKNAKALADAIGEAAPNGIDVYFDNVGGEQLDAALACMNWQGRIAACGMISEYDRADPSTMHNLFQIVGKTLTVNGFLVFTYMEQFPVAINELAGWISEGRIKVSEDIEEGLENAVPGFLKLFSGGNTGKAMVKIAEL